MARNHVLFTSLSRRKRRSATLKIKNLIYKERAVWGGVFYDECEHDAAVASGGWTWSDIVFLGRPSRFLECGDHHGECGF